MNKKDNIKYCNLPIINKGKLYTQNSTEKKETRILTTILVMGIICALLFCGYSMGKSIEEYIIKSKTEIAEPILVVENNPSLNITANENTGTYTFKVKNYNENNQITQTDLRYYIEILHNVNDLVNIELYENENKINLNNNKTDFFEILKDKMVEREYKIKITYNNDESNTINDIMEKIQVKVYSEQLIR